MSERINEHFYEAWNTYTDEKLQRQYLYVMNCPNDKKLKLTITKLMNDRGLKSFEDEVIDAEFKKAMQTYYAKDSELLDRVYAVLYTK